MPNAEMTSRNAPIFAEIYYDFASEDHFWVRARFQTLLRMIAKLGLDLRQPRRGLDIGCGEGVAQRQFATATAWRVEGCELNRVAFAKHSSRKGGIFLYDVTERRPDLCERYDFLVLFDVVEHIEDTKAFLEAAAYHLKPGGHVFINVPAGPRLYSRYDEILGHYRRYQRATLQSDIARAGLTIAALQYWGWPLLPAALARKFLADRKPDDGDADAIMRAGFNPPNSLASALLSAVLVVESLFPPAPFGTSLLAIARKPG